MKTYFSALIVFILTAKTYSLDYDGWLNVQLKHSFGADDFTERGNITTLSIRMNSFNIDQKPLREDQMKRLEAAAERDELYSIKATVQSTDGSELDFLTSMKASALLDCHLQDTISITISPTGSVICITAAPLKLDTQPTFLSKIFKTQVFVRQTEQGPVPDTASYIQKMEREREARDKGDVKDNRSFLAKYWMYIVPVVLFVLISGAANPEQPR